tara:strand:+ start:439 stop:699 length:261 start_codon:yes stop_codon:yes gene_type:complete
MNIKQKIQMLVAGLKYQTSFEDVSNEPSYVVDQILNLIEKEIKLDKKYCYEDNRCEISDECCCHEYNKACDDLEALKKKRLGKPME